MKYFWRGLAFINLTNWKYLIPILFFKKIWSDKFTDDASVFEAKGGRITTLLGEEKNLKITTREDLTIANEFMQ